MLQTRTTDVNKIRQAAKGRAGAKTEQGLNIHAPVNQQYRPHMLNILKKLRQSKRFVKRVLYVANIIDADSRSGDIEKSLTQYFKEFVNQDNEQEITGLCLVLGTYCINFLEGDGQVVTKTLKSLNEQARQHGSLYNDIVIVSFMEDCQDRIFKCWMVKNLNVAASGGSGEVPQRTSFDKGVSLFQAFSQISGTVNTSFQKSLTAVSSTLKAQASEFLPPLEQLADFFTEKKFMTIQQFSQQFFELPDLVLEDELIWPITQKLTY